VVTKLINFIRLCWFSKIS